MDVRGPGPGNNLNATYRLEHSGEAIPREHLKQTESDDHARAPEVGKLLLELREIPEIRPGGGGSGETESERWNVSLEGGCGTSICSDSWKSRVGRISGRRDDQEIE